MAIFFTFLQVYSTGVEKDSYKPTAYFLFTPTQEARHHHPSEKPSADSLHPTHSYFSQPRLALT